MDERSLNLTIAGYRRREPKRESDDDFDYQEDLDEYGGVMDESQGWSEARIFKSFKFKITQGVDVFATEVQQKELLQFTDRHDTN